MARAGAVPVSSAAGAGADRWLPAAVALLAAAVFARAAGQGFLWYDDHVMIFRNPQVAAGLGAGSVAWAFTSGEQANWYPVTRLFELALVSLFGMRPAAFHAASVLLHALAAAFFCRFLLRTTGRRWPALLAAGLFALHPLRVESVAWATEIKDPLSGLLFMACLERYAAWAARPSPGRRLAWHALAVLGFAAKPMLVTLPGVLLLLDAWPLGRTSPGAAGPEAPGLRALVAEKVPLLALAAVVALVAFLTQSGADAVLSYPPLVRVGNAGLSVLAYLGQTLVPVGLAPAYPHPGDGLPVARAALAWLGVFLLTGLAGRSARSNPAALAGWLWFLLMLLPVLGLVQVGAQGRADRFTYLPSAGLAVAVVWAAARPARLLPVPALAGVLAAVAAALAALTWVQIGYWGSDLALWERSLAVTGRNWYASYSHGTALERAGRHDEAIARYRSALELNPRSGEVRCALGAELLRTGRVDEAIVRLGEGLALRPSPACRNALGVALSSRGRTAEAAEHFREALRLDPANDAYRGNLERALAASGAAPAR
jgi:hypothetical protein